MIQLVGGEAVFELSLHGLPRVHVFSWKHSFRSHLTVEQVDLIISYSGDERILIWAQHICYVKRKNRSIHIYKSDQR